MRASLEALEKEHLLRKPAVLEEIHGPYVRIQGCKRISWCSNDYLGLSQHPALVEAAASAASRWGTGSRASRLLAGTTLVHESLEEALAGWFDAQAALVYPSGYLANLGTLAALLTKDDAVIVDRLSHASLLDAARATSATFRVFHHNDMNHLASVLTRFSKAKRRFVVTEGVFSMDGDSSPLSELNSLCERFGAVLYVDDAHGAFVCGKTGRGSPEKANVAASRMIYMGTLGKALGAQGGFVIGPKTFIGYLQNKARSFIYSTALAPAAAAAALAAIKLLEKDDRLRVTLNERTHRLQQKLKPMTSEGDACHIKPVILGSASRAVAASEKLLKEGHWVPPIRPPTVPENTSRLRISVTALHSAGQIDELSKLLLKSVG